MSFLNPIMLFGLGAVAVPIVIHLLNRRKFQKLAWAAMRFLKTSVELTRRRSRVEDLLLLLLRCLLLALLALAAARPALKSSALPVLAGPTKSTAVLLLDNSMSMALTDGAQSAFDQALKAAEQVVSEFAEGSSAALYLVSDTVRPVIPEPSYDLNLVRKMIREAKLSDRATDLYPGMAAAVDTLARRPGTGKEIFLITDGQASGWKRIGEIQKLLQKSKEIRAHILLVGQNDDRNVAIQDIELAGGLSPVGRPLRFEVQVKNWGREMVRDLKVNLSVDAESPGDEFTIEQIAPGATRNVALFAKVRDLGFHSVNAVIAGDRLKADDRRSVVVHAFKELRVLLVDGDPGTEPRESETFFLRHALQPVAVESGGSYYIKPTVISPAGLASVHENDFDAIILANVASLPEEAVNGFAAYLDAGGGLIIFPGDRIDPAFYNQRFLSREILPASIGPARGTLENDEKFFQVQEKKFTHPVTSIWNDPAAGTLASARFFRAFELRPVPTNTVARAETNAPARSPGPPRVVLSYADGSPAVMERTYGLGQVFLFSSSADTAWNDLPVRPAFVPLLHRILGSILHRRQEGLTIPVGQTLVYRASGEQLGKEAVIYRPDRRQEGRDFRTVEMVAGWPMLQFDGTDAAGTYEVSIPGSASRVLFATQTDPAESNLQPLSAVEVKNLEAVAHVARWSPAQTLKERKEARMAGVELWFPFMLAVLVAAIAETFFSFWFSRAK